MDIMATILLIICSILYYIDFVYILRNKKFLFKKEKSGQRMAAGKLEAWVSFFVASLALYIVISRIMDDTTNHFMLLVLLIIVNVATGRRKVKGTKSVG